MITDHTTKRIQRLLNEAEKLETQVAEHQSTWAQWELKNPSGKYPDWLIEQKIETEDPFIWTLESLYLATICHLDYYGLTEYIKQFYNRFGSSFNLDKRAMDFESNHFSDSSYSIYLVKLRQFLATTGPWDDTAAYNSLSGIIYLKNILKSTATIIHKQNLTPSGEVEVYKAVRNVLESVFPSSKQPRSKFIKTAQEYKPDILIPELAAAVEYKYADSESRLKTTIAQIADDVKGYTGDDDYRHFFAVFYVKADYWGSEKFRSVWREKKFPRNWRAYYVVGR